MSTDENKPTETRPAPPSPETRPAPPPGETRPAQQQQVEEKALTASDVMATVEAVSVTAFSVAGTAQIVKGWKQPTQPPTPQASASEQAPAGEAPAPDAPAE